MESKAKHTVESVANDLREEYTKLTADKFEFVGDVNYEDYGGVFYKRGNGPNEIQIVFYHGYDNIPRECPNRYECHCTLDELIDAIDEIWSYADVENCGLNIGWTIQSFQSWSGFLELY